MYIFFFFTALELVFEKRYLRENAEGSSAKSEPSSPLRKSLPDLRTLGPLPAKPPRPPLVDLSRYQAPIVNSRSYFSRVIFE